MKVRERFHGKKKIVAIALALFMALQCFPVATLAETGKATIVNKGDTPTPPPNLSAKILISVQGKKYVYLTWGASKDTCSGIQQYDIYRNGKLIMSTKNRKFTDYNVNENEKYIYKVVAKDYKNHTSKPSQTPVITLTDKPKEKVVKDLNGNTKTVPATSVSKIKKSGGMLDGYNRIIHVQTGKVDYVPISASAKKKSTSIPVIDLRKVKSSGVSLNSGLNLSKGTNLSKSANLSNSTNVTGNLSAPNLNLNSSLNAGNLTKLPTVGLSARVVNLLK